MAKIIDILPDDHPLKVEARARQEEYAAKRRAYREIHVERKIKTSNKEDAA